MSKVNIIDSLQRTVYFDYLRVFAMLSVVVLHISATNWGHIEVMGIKWQTFNFFNGISRWGVPVFVMISGALFLERDIPVSKIYSKYILRMLTAFFSWSTIYALLSEEKESNFISKVFEGHYHMWYIPMIIGLYISLPLLKPIAENKRTVKYYLALAFVFAFFIPLAVLILKDFGGEGISDVTATLENLKNDLYLHGIIGYIGYFFLGYYINKVELTAGQRKVIYFLGILGFVFTVAMGAAVSMKSQVANGNYYSSNTVNVMLEALSVFVFFKYRKYKLSKLNFVMKVLAKYSFGAYLVHALVMEQLNIQFGLNTLIYHPVLSVLLITALVLAISYVISAILNIIPVLNKYIV